MTAGRSARERAEQDRLNAAGLQRRADHLARQSANYEQGARGEEEVSWEIDQLASQGWMVLHDRRLPTGANLDHLLVGPPGVSVIETKTWSGHLTVGNGRIEVDGRRRAKELDQVRRQVEAVRSALVDSGSSVAVQGFLLLAGPHHRDQPPTEIDGIVVIGLHRITARVGTADATSSQAQIEDAFRILSLAFPGSWQTTEAVATIGGGDTEGAPAEAEPARSRTAHRYFYLRRWRRGGHDRLYLRSPEAQLGWKDLKSGEWTVETSDKDTAKLADAVLKAAQPTSVPLAAGDLPRVYAHAPGGRLVSRLARLHLAVVVGHEWKKGRTHRLYGSFIAPDTAAIALGFIDLTNGNRTLDIDGPVAKDRPTADRYLEVLHQLLPGPEQSA